MMVAVKLAFRNLTRNRWRSGLTLAGIAVAVGLLVWTLAFYEGWIVEMVRGATAVETTQLQIQTAGWADNPRVYRSFPADDAMFAEIRGVSEVLALSPRVEAYGLIGNEERSRVARFIGVDPELEAATTPLPDGVVDGRWLASAPRPTGSPREVVVGADLARNLRVGMGAELVAFLEAADGSLGNDLLEVVGTVRTGNTAVDRSAAYLHLADMQDIAALDGEVNVILVRTARLDAAREAAAQVALAVDARVGAPTPAEGVEESALVVRPWQELVPALDQMILLIRRSYWVIYLIVYVVAAVGILNTQRMSALERRREFGVLMAIGVRPRRMYRILQVETVTLGLVGAVVGTLVGGALSWYHAVAGLNLTLLTDQASFSYMGVAFSDRIHSVLTAQALLQPFVVMLFVALVSGLWPAISAARVDPAPAIAGRT